MDQKTAEGLEEHNALFQEAIEEGIIDICIWDRSGTTVDTALPGIREMIEGIDDWQAVVIDSDCPDEVDTAVHAKGNPFDFAGAGNKDAGMGSTIPIIRLSNMLGGLTHPELSFKTEIKTERNKKEHVVYVPEEEKNQKNIDEYNKLAKLYDFDGIRPYQILLISTLLIPEQEMNKDVNWDRSARESQSSEFWRRNGYSSSSRFLKYEYDCTGSLNRARQKLKFWLSVLLLSINYIDPSAIQAYRLYKINVQMDSAELKNNFQEEINQLVAARHVLDKRIRILSDDTLSTPGKIPDLETEIDLVPDTSSERFTEPSSKISYGIFGGNANSEIAKWDNYCNGREEYYRKSAKSIDRSLDMTAYSTKKFMRVRTGDVESLNRYQRDDINEKADNYLNAILEEQGDLPDLGNMDSAELTAAKKNVRMDIRKRIKGTPVYICTGAAILLFILSFIPDMILNHTSDFPEISISVLLFIICMVIVVVCSLLYFKNQLKVLIDKYRKLMSSALESLNSNKETYEKYINNIASYSKTRSYIKAEGMKHKEDQDECELLRRDIRKIDEQTDKLISWSKAFGVDLDGTYDAVEGNALEKNGIPDKHKLFELKYKRGYQIELNRSGEMIYSPFSFVQKLEVYREELYDTHN